jgi:DNA-binding NarL/FixJ family response regulator
MSPSHDRSMISADSGSTRASPRPTRVLDAVLLGTNDDTRLLLRGLLRLHHHRVVLEARSLDDLAALAPAAGPRVLLQDVDAEDERWSEELVGALRAHPDLRAVVLLPTEGGGMRAEAMRAGACGVLVRPFAIRDLVRLVDEAAFGPGPTSPAASDRQA